jgi:hypothetical protein
MAEFYVYILFRPDGRPCYVGKGRGDRWLDHERDGARHQNRHMANILKAAGRELPKIKGLTEAEAFALAPDHVEKIRAGLSGKKHPGRSLSMETRAKIAAAHQGKKRSEEAKAKMRLTWLGRTHTEESKARMSAAAKARRPRVSATPLEGNT